jgi:hypothetical protein
VQVRLDLLSHAFARGVEKISLTKATGRRNVNATSYKKRILLNIVDLSDQFVPINLWMKQQEKEGVRMSIQEVSPEKLGELFHHYHQILAPDFGGAINSAAPEAWDELPQAEKRLIVAAARMALLEIASLPTEDSRRYYAKPGEAEWGC